MVNWGWRQLNPQEASYCRQQLNILDPVLDNAGVIVLIPKLVTDQHTHATLTDVNTCTNNSISDQYGTTKIRTLVDQHTSNWAKAQESVLWMGVFCHSPQGSAHFRSQALQPSLWPWTTRMLSSEKMPDEQMSQFWGKMLVLYISSIWCHVDAYWWCSRLFTPLFYCLFSIKTWAKIPQSNEFRHFQTQPYFLSMRPEARTFLVADICGTDMRSHSGLNRRT